MPAVAQAQYSGVNGQVIGITYPGSQQYNGAITAYNADGSNRHVIYGPDTDPATLGISNPEVSKDGTMILFLDGTPTAGRNVFKINSDGTGLTQVTNGVNNFVSAKFSADGTKVVAVEDGNNGNTITSRNLDGTGVITIRTGNNTVGGPGPEFQDVTISPDGTQLLSTVLTPSNSNISIYSLPADGSAAETLFMSGGRQADFSPSGTQVAYTVGGLVYVVAATGGTATAITDNTLYASFPSWAPDGTGIAFSGFTATTNIGNVYMVKPDGTGLVKQTANPDATVTETQFRWSQLASTNGSTGPFGATPPGTPSRTVTTVAQGDNQPAQAVTVAANNTLIVDGVRGDITVQSGGILGGHGTVGTVTVQSGGTLAPGNSPGCLASGNVTLVSGANYDVDIAGVTVCTEYDQQVVTGTVDLGNATLNVNLTYVPVAGAKFKIISNDAADPIVGTFAGLTEGATVTANGYNFTISYIGGDGNDVELTAVGPVVVPALPAAARSNGSAPLLLVIFAILSVTGIEIGRRVRARR